MSLFTCHLVGSRRRTGRLPLTAIAQHRHHLNTMESALRWVPIRCQLLFYGFLCTMENYIMKLLSRYNNIPQRIPFLFEFGYFLFCFEAMGLCAYGSLLEVPRGPCGMPEIKL